MESRCQLEQHALPAALHHQTGANLEASRHWVPFFPIYSITPLIHRPTDSWISNLPLLCLQGKSLPPNPRPTPVMPGPTKRKAALAAAAAVLACCIVGLHAVKVPLAGGGRDSAASLKTPWHRWFREKEADTLLVTGALGSCTNAGPEARNAASVALVKPTPAAAHTLTLGSRCPLLDLTKTYSPCRPQGSASRASTLSVKVCQRCCS